jgi:biopolymer transport protein ExbD
VQGRKVASVADVIKSSSTAIPSLKNELDRLTSRKFGTVKTKDGKPIARQVTIMGDRKIPFNLLKKIMLTCTQASYSNISLAVMRKPEKG